MSKNIAENLTYATTLDTQGPSSSKTNVLRKDVYSSTKGYQGRPSFWSSRNTKLNNKWVMESIWKVPQVGEIELWRRVIDPLLEIFLYYTSCPNLIKVVWHVQFIATCIDRISSSLVYVSSLVDGVPIFRGTMRCFFVLPSNRGRSNFE